MIHSTHMLFGVFLILALYEGIPSLKTYAPFVFAMIIAPFGALVPDLDHPKGYMSRGSWEVVSLAVRKTTTHRGWTHSLVGAVFFTVIAGVVFWYFKANLSYTIPFFIGYISHLISDSLNPTGVNWFWPKVKKKYKVGLIRTGSRRESIFQNGLSFGIAGIFIYDLFFNSGMLLK
jgi:inner membrane protein